MNAFPIANISQTRRLTIIASAIFLFALPAFLFAKDTAPAKDDKSAAAKPNFDHVGPQVGDQLPDLKLRTLKGEPQRLADAWHAGPALIVTSSFTCPKSRSRWPELKAIVEKYEDKLNVVIVYVIEAHPVGSVCPYKGVEEITPENQRDGILRHQPKTLDERLELAQDFKRYLHVNTPIYVDTIKNEAWKAFGAAPNIAFLVDRNGIVAARQGWFESDALQKPLAKFIEKSMRDDDARKSGYELERKAGNELVRKAEAAGVLEAAFRGHVLIQNKSTEEIETLLKHFPEFANCLVPAQEGHHRETTVLMEAILAKKPDLVELLLKHGAVPETGTRTYGSALDLAAQEGNAEMVKTLLLHKANPNAPSIGKTPLHEALLASNCLPPQEGKCVGVGRETALTR